MFEFAKQMYFDENALVDKCVEDESLIRSLKSLANMGRSLTQKSFSKAKVQSPRGTKTTFVSSILMNFAIE